MTPSFSVLYRGLTFEMLASFSDASVLIGQQST